MSEMRIFVRRNDSVARDFVVGTFGVSALRQLEPWDEFGLPGGGLRPVLVGMAEEGEVKGAFSCRTLAIDALAEAVGWHELLHDCLEHAIVWCKNRAAQWSRQNSDWHINGSKLWRESDYRTSA